MLTLVCSCHVVPGRRGRSHGVCRGGAAPAAARPSAGEIGALTAGANAGSRLGAAPAASACRWRTGLVAETNANTLAGHDVVFLALPHGASAEVAAQLDPRDPGDRLRCGLPAGRPGGLAAVLRLRPRRHLAVRAAGAARAARQAGRRPADRRPRLLPDDRRRSALLPAITAAADRRRRTW